MVKPIETQYNGYRFRSVDDILDFICAIASHHHIFYLWRPLLRDLKDDLMLELAVAAECDFIVTFNQRNFVGSEQFGIEVLGPKAFLQHIGVLS